MAETTSKETKESSSVEETIKKAKGVDPGEAIGPPLVQSTTEQTPSPADETSVPNHLNTEIDGRAESPAGVGAGNSS